MNIIFIYQFYLRHKAKNMVLHENPTYLAVSSWYNGESDGLRNRNKWVQTPLWLSNRNLSFFFVLG